MPQNRKHIIEQRRSRVAELYLKGCSQLEIAGKVRVSQAQVSKDLKIIGRRWQEASQVSIDRIKARDLAKLAHLEKTYHDAWTRSTQEQFTERTKETTIKNGVGSKETVFEIKTTVGDARFLDGVLKCLVRRAEILGYDAPSKRSIDAALSIDHLSEDQADEILEKVLQAQNQNKDHGQTEQD